MKITMLGTSGSGKTTYMSAMSELFYNSDVQGYTIANRDDDYSSNAFIFREFASTNTLYQAGRFPSGTSTSVIMPLELRFRGNHILDIDWIDYRGYAITELASGVESEQNAEIFAALLASDVVLVFVDAAVLKVCANLPFARSRVGANEIAHLLCYVSRKKKIDVIFLLSKFDSSIIDPSQDLSQLKIKLGQAYSRFFIDTNTSLTNYHIVPVGAVGFGNVITTSRWIPDAEGGQTVQIDHKVTNLNKLSSFNVASSFALALIKCFNRETNRLNTEASEVASELERLKRNFGPVKQLIDILFFKSSRRETIYDLEHKIIDSRSELMGLQPYRAQLEGIANSGQ